MLLIFSGQVLPVHAVVFHVALLIGTGNNAHGALYTHGPGLLLMAGTRVLAVGVFHKLLRDVFKGMGVGCKSENVYL